VHLTDRPLQSAFIPFAVACLGIALFSLMDGYMKGLSIAIGAYNAMLWRLLLGSALAAILFIARREKLPTTAAMRLHLLRGTVTAVMATMFFYGLARVPLAEGVALSFIAPLITLYLAAVLLGEKISAAAIAASVLGIAGVVVILAGRIGGEPHNDEALWGVFAILVSAVLYAYNLILQRQQAQVATPSEIALFQSLCAGAVLALVAPWLAVVPSVQHLPDLAISAALTMGALLLLSWAYARAQAQVLVTVEYTAFIWASIFGWLFFREAVTLPTIIGTALIVTGCIIAARQKPASPTQQIEANN
jgi:S-adenosylmethionine uptake transporter